MPLPSACRALRAGALLALVATVLGSDSVSHARALEEDLTPAFYRESPRGRDPVYDSFSCPSFMTAFENTATQTKGCTLNVSVPTAGGLPWGPVQAYLWSGDLGYWADRQTVRARARVHSALPVRVHRTPHL